MVILGVDTSCDDTSASVVEDGRRILSNVVSSQTEIHTKYGGIVPELASRRHIEMILPVVDEALKQAEISFSELSCIAVCQGPGLIGSLLVGCSFSKAISYAKGIPLVSVNHLEGHLLSAFLETRPPDFPFLSLVVSGGHTSLYIAEDFGKYRELGRTRDDAAGEAYDKVAKLLGLGYPGGPIIDELSKKGNTTIDFPRAYLPDSFDFSFSGLKTAVLNFVRARANENRLDPHLVCDIAASFQAAVVDVLARKVELAITETGIKRITLAGGVAANSGLRETMKTLGRERGAEVFAPALQLCTDNAAMIAAAGYHHFKSRDLAGLDLNPVAYLPLGSKWESDDVPL